MEVFDGHIHVFPRVWQQRIYQWFERADWNLYYRDFFEEAIWAEAQVQGVSAASILVYAHRPGLARDLNRWLFEWAQARPELHLYGTVHPDDGDASSIVEEALDIFHFDGFKIHCNVQRVAADDRRLDVVYRAVLDRDRSIVMHVGSEPHPNAFVGSEPFRRLMARYPQLRVQVAHLGANEVDDFLEMAQAYPNIYLDTAAIPGTRLLLPAEKLAKIAQNFPHRLIYGSDLPILEEPLTAHQERVIQATRQAQRQVFHDNLVRFWHGTSWRP